MPASGATRSRSTCAVVEPRGIEPLTSAVRLRTTEKRKIPKLRKRALNQYLTITRACDLTGHFRRFKTLVASKL